MQISKIRKRNGNIVDFEAARIMWAVERAFTSTGISLERSFFEDFTKEVVSELQKGFEGRMPGVEDVQNIVERMIVKAGYFEVARSYIIYRYEHHKQREKKQQEFLEKIEKDTLLITKRSGKKEKFSLEKIKKCVSYFIKGYEKDIDVELIVKQCRNELYEGITTADIFKTLIGAARSFIEIDPAYSKLAMRLLYHDVYHEVIGKDFDIKKLDQQYREAFVRNIRRGVEIGRFDPKLLIYDLEKISALLLPERDDLFMFLGAHCLYDRYFAHDPYERKVLETPQAFWMRIALGIALQEENKIERVKEFYDVLSQMLYVPSTPTLFHSGMVKAQLSSCYLNTVMDSLDHIFDVISDNAQLSKWSGGIGTDWTNVRATGSLIKGTGVESQGIIPFLKIANDTTVAINRSGRRRGATCVYLETWHYDIEEFLELRKNTGDERRRTHDMNTANWIPDLFMKRVRDDGEWTLFSPDETPELHHLYGRRFEEKYAHYEQCAKQGKMKLSRTLRARDLWKKMLAMLYETGHPWIVFKDPCNVRSPQDHCGVVHNSNLCTEITLNNSAEETAVCNLGSLNLIRHVHNGAMNFDLLAQTTRTAMRMLDNVIDLNFYPTEETKVSNMRHRPVALGIMGFQDLVYSMDYVFDSEETVQLADENMEFISYHAILASTQLAQERGAYSSFSGSKWDRGLLPVDTLDLMEQERGEKIPVSRTGKLDWTPVREAIKNNGMRNSNCFAMAPTSNLGNISGCFPTIEPIYKNVYVKSNLSGDFVVINSYLVEDLKKCNLWDTEMLTKLKYADGSIRDIPEIPEKLKTKYKEVFDIEPEWLVKIAAYRGKWIDQSQSLNIFFRGTSGKILNDVYFYAWSMGLKTTYYLRTLAASQVEKSTVNQEQSHVRKDSVVTASVQGKDKTPLVAAQEIQESFTRETILSSVGAAAAPKNFSPSVPDAPQEFQKKEEITQVSSGLKLCKIDDPACESCE